MELYKSQRGRMDGKGNREREMEDRKGDREGEREILSLINSCLNIN